jgi:hypothetical protein
MSLSASINARAGDDADHIARLRKARVTTFASAGALGVFRGAIGYRHPSYWAPTTTLDWTAVATFTAFLLAAACALLVLAHEHRGVARLAFALAAFGAALAGVGNALEDGAGVSECGSAFAAGILVMVAGLLVAGILGARPSGRPRWLGPLLFANIALLGVSFDTLGLAFFGATWIVLAVFVGRGLGADFTLDPDGTIARVELS